MSWILWVIVACGFGVGEVHTQSFYLAPFAAGAGLAAASAAFGAGQLTSVAIFMIASVLTLLTLRPLVRAHTRTPPRLRTGGAALEGRDALVLERIANDEGVGCVRIGSEIWTARSLDDGVIETGTKVQVVQIRGATALVVE